MLRKILFVVLVSTSLSGCLTNKTTTYVYDYDDYDGKVVVEEEQKEEVTFAGTILAVGAAAALVLAAMAETGVP